MLLKVFQAGRRKRLQEAEKSTSDAGKSNSFDPFQRRDTRPKNLWVTGSGNRAKAVEKATSSESTSNSAKEQFVKKPSVSATTDSIDISAPIAEVT